MEKIQELAQASDIIIRIDGHALWDVVCVEQAPFVNEHQNHLLGSACDNFGLNSAWCALFNPLHEMVFLFQECAWTQHFCLW
jgi:hypothetical protein